MLSEQCVNLFQILFLQVRVQSDPAGRLVISGDPEHPDNPWGVTPFKKVLTDRNFIKKQFILVTRITLNNLHYR